jgi:hypothetical protein
MCGRGPATARGARAGGEPGLRAPCPCRAGSGPAGPDGRLAVSAGWMAGIRGKAAALIEASGFAGGSGTCWGSAGGARGRDPGPCRRRAAVRAPGLHPLPGADAHGDRSAAAIDAGGVLPGYRGILVRDGYHGYCHLHGAAHAWCAAHLLRDLKASMTPSPAGRNGPRRWPACCSGPATTAAAARAPARPGWTPPSSMTWPPATRQPPPRDSASTCSGTAPPPARAAPWPAGPAVQDDDPPLRHPPRPGHLHGSTAC